MADEIRLSLPAQPDFARLARLAAASVAARLGFTYDELEDVRMAVGESWSLLLPHPGATGGRTGTIEVALVLGPGTLEVTLQGHGLPLPPSSPAGAGDDEGTGPDLSRQVLAAVVDDVDIDLGASRVRLQKHRAAPPA